MSPKLIRCRLTLIFSLLPTKQNNPHSTTQDRAEEGMEEISGKQLKLFTSGERSKKKLPQQQQLEELEVSFLNRGFCQVGLPLRRLSDETASWKRADGRFAFKVDPGSVMLPDGREMAIGVPFGPKARLLNLWLTTEVKDTKRAAGDRWIEFGRISSWLRAVGIEPRGGKNGSIGAAKEQLVRLVFGQFSMSMLDHEDRILFNRESLVQGAIFSRSDIEAWIAGGYGAISWPTGVLLTQNAYDRLSRHTVPIPTERIRGVANNALALDTLAYLCYRLPEVPAGNPQLAAWKDLFAHFGTADKLSTFKRQFCEALRTVLEACPEARVDIIEEGLLLRHSDPIISRTTMIALPGGKEMP
jgi:hypothetical protein